jgi:hypothetical protein
MLNKKGVDWSSPETLVTILLIVLLALIFFFVFVRGKIGGILKI